MNICQCFPSDAWNNLSLGSGEVMNKIIGLGKALNMGRRSVMFRDSNIIFPFICLQKTVFYNH